MNHIRQAVILAAGMGSRLKGTIEEKPKGFLQFGNKSIIEESITKLIGVGITKIVIVTGYHSEYYDMLKEKYPFVVTIKNQDFDKTGSMYSLFTAKKLIESDFLLLESDLIYECKALQVTKTQHSVIASYYQAAQIRAMRFMLESMRTKLLTYQRILVR